jgi:dihydroorotate dehydrogenase
VYRLFFDLVLRRLPAETAHRLSLHLLRWAAAVPGVCPLLRRALGSRDPVLRIAALGMTLDSPIGLAAGFDKDGEAPDALGALGFSFVELGTVTARAQIGNPRPRILRAAPRALVNRMGFPNRGSAALARRLQHAPPRIPAGVNIGRSRAAADADAVADYVASAARLRRCARFVVVNVSSPNTPGLRALQEPAVLRPLLAAVRETLDEGGRHVPLLVKISPDLHDAEIDAIADLALELGLDGIVATNTTTARDGLLGGDGVIADLGAGGVSGAPLRARSLAVLGRLRARTGDRLTLVSVGGIESPQDAWERIAAGATLLQAYTGFVYGGPLWVWRLHRGLARELRRRGHRHIGDAVGCAGSVPRGPREATSAAGR